MGMRSEEKTVKKRITQLRKIDQGILTDTQKGRVARRVCVRCAKYTTAHRPGEIQCFTCRVKELPVDVQISRSGSNARPAGRDGVPGEYLTAIPEPGEVPDS
jgi:hypothetical protein